MSSRAQARSKSGPHVSVACGLVGLVSSRYIGLLAMRDVLTRNTVPVSLYLWDHYEHARCEESPATWTLTTTPGSHGFAYDAETLLSHNPEAPPIDRVRERAIPGVG